MTSALQHPIGLFGARFGARPVAYTHTPASLRFELDQLHRAYATTATDLDGVRSILPSLFGRPAGKRWIFERIG